MTEGNPDPVLIQVASQGTLSVLAIFGLIYRFLTEANEVDKASALHRRAIVIIDELDAHLHPSWQQRIAGLLRKNFPNVQFIISAHSPLLVAGCGIGEVSVMRKKDSRFEIETIEDRDFVGAKAEDIYNQVFGINDGEDEIFLEHSRLAAKNHDNRPKIAELRAKDQLTSEEELELRQLQNQQVFMRRALVVEEERAQEADKWASLETECSMLRNQVRNLQDELQKSITETTAQETRR
jgi:predicted ATP-binding protein involved in virulence